VEFGTKIRKSKNGVSKGKINPKPVVTPLIDRQIPSIINWWNTDFGKTVDQIIKRKLKKLSKK
jgi:hypothetical protein